MLQARSERAHVEADRLIKPPTDLSVFETSLSSMPADSCFMETCQIHWRPEIWPGYLPTGLDFGEPQTTNTHGNAHVISGKAPLLWLASAHTHRLCIQRRRLKSGEVAPLESAI